MSVAPLFVSDVAALRAQLRLTGAVSGDASKVIDAAIQTARLLFFDRLASTRVSVLLSYAYADNPSTSEEILRVRACLTEVAIVRRELIRRMPTMFVEGNSANSTWNDESIARENPPASILGELTRLSNEIEDGMLSLEGSSDDADGGVQSFDGTPDGCDGKPQPKLAIGNSIRGIDYPRL